MLVTSEKTNGVHVLTIAETPELPERVDNRVDAKTEHKRLSKAVLGLAAEIYQQMKAGGNSLFEFQFKYDDNRLETTGSPVKLSIEVPNANGNVGLLNLGNHEFPMIETEKFKKPLYRPPKVVRGNNRLLDPDFFDTVGINGLNRNINALSRRSVVMEAVSIFLRQQVEEKQGKVGS